MPRYTVLLPQRNTTGAVRQTVAAVLPVLAQMEGSYELLVIDAGSAEPAFAELLAYCQQVPGMRLLQCPGAQNASIATSAGISAAKGEYLLCLDPAGQFDPSQLLNFTAQLARADAVFGKRNKQGLPKLWQRLARVPRWLLLGLNVRDLGCRPWVARREAVRGLEPARGLLRSLADLISMRGFRVCEIPCEYQPSSQTLSDGWPNPLDLCSLWWRKRRYAQETAREVPLGHATVPLSPANARRGKEEQASSVFHTSPRRQSA